MSGEKRRQIEWSIVTFLMRLPIGVLFFFAGLGKFLGGHGKFVAYLVNDMSAKTWLPHFSLVLFANVLPFVELTVGALLLVGLLTRPVLVVTALLLTTLAFGKVLAQDNQTVAQNINYVFITAIAFFFSRRDLFSLDTLMFKKKAMPEFQKGE